MQELIQIGRSAFLLDFSNFDGDKFHRVKRFICGKQVNRLYTLKPIYKVVNGENIFHHYVINIEND